MYWCWCCIILPGMAGRIHNSKRAGGTIRIVCGRPAARIVALAPAVYRLCIVAAEGSHEYWAEAGLLEGETAVGCAPSACGSSPAGRSEHKEMVELEIDKDLLDAIHQLSREQEVTLFMTLLACSRWCYTATAGIRISAWEAR